MTEEATTIQDKLEEATKWLNYMKTCHTIQPDDAKEIEQVYEVIKGAIY